MYFVSYMSMNEGHVYNLSIYGLYINNELDKVYLKNEIFHAPSKLAVRYKSIQIVVLQTLHRESCEKNIQFEHCFVSNQATFDLFRI